MLDWLWPYIQAHPSETVVISGIVLFSLLTSLALVQQAHRIWTKRSGESLSVTWIVYFIAMFCAGALYGWSHHDPVILLNNALFVGLHLPIAAGLWRFKGFTVNEKIFALGLSVPLILMFNSGLMEQRWWFLAFAFGGAGSLILQMVEMWKRGHIGVVDPRLLVVYLLSNVFWTGYAFCGSDPALQIICPLNLTLFTIMVSLWLKLRADEARAPTLQ